MTSCIGDAHGDERLPLLRRNDLVLGDRFNLQPLYHRPGSHVEDLFDQSGEMLSPASSTEAARVSHAARPEFRPEIRLIKQKPLQLPG
jgi:hypothetical protein